MGVAWVVAVVLLLVHLSSSSWIEEDSVEDYPDFHYSIDSDPSSDQSSILLNILLKGMPLHDHSPLSHPDAPHPGAPHAGAPHTGAPHPSTPHEREKKSSVSWLLAAAIKMCQKQPADCLRRKEFAQLDPSILQLMQGGGASE